MHCVGSSSSRAPANEPASTISAATPGVRACALLVESCESAPGVNPGGREFVYGQFVERMWNRLRVVDYVRRHPEVLDERVERPLVVLGLPRTGTSLASYLLDQDPLRRSLLTWEAEDSVPPSTPDTLRTDPRCLKKKAELDVLAEGLKAANIPLVHWDEADGPTECLFVQNQDFKAYLWEAFMPTPAYADWLLQTDMSSAYAYERMVLQVLQSRAPGTWSLKMPSHAVHIETLLDDLSRRADRVGAPRSLQVDRVVSAAELPVPRGNGRRHRRRRDRGKCVAPVEGTRRSSAGDAAPDRRRSILRPALRRPDARPDRGDAVAVRLGR